MTAGDGSKASRKPQQEQDDQRRLSLRPRPSASEKIRTGDRQSRDGRDKKAPFCAFCDFLEKLLSAIFADPARRSACSEKIFNKLLTSYIRYAIL